MTKSNVLIFSRLFQICFYQEKYYIIREIMWLFGHNDTDYNILYNRGPLYWRGRYTIQGFTIISYKYIYNSTWERRDTHACLARQVLFQIICRKNIPPWYLQSDLLYGCKHDPASKVGLWRNIYEELKSQIPCLFSGHLL